MKLVLLMCAVFVTGRTFSDPEVAHQADGASDDPVPVANEQPALDVSPASVSIDDIYGLRRLKLPELDIIYAQHPLSSKDDSYPKWNPADSACALHPQNAKNLAVDAVKRMIPEIITCTAYDIALESRPSCSDTFWYYSVKLDLFYENKVAHALNTIIVGINGYVPPIDRMTQDEWEKYAEVQKEKMTNVAEAWLREAYKLVPTPELKKRLEDAGITIPEEAKE